MPYFNDYKEEREREYEEDMQRREEAGETCHTCGPIRDCTCDRGPGGDYYNYGL